MAVLIMVMFLMAVLALCSVFCLFLFSFFFFCVAVFKAHLKAMLLFAANIDILKKQRTIGHINAIVAFFDGQLTVTLA